MTGGAVPVDIAFDERVRAALTRNERVTVIGFARGPDRFEARFIHRANTTGG